MVNATDSKSSICRPPQLSTGVAGLDEILAGGLTPNRIYLVEGAPGTGKTTLGLQYLMEGARRGEKVLYLCLSETHDELQEVADSHGWDLSGIAIVEPAVSEESLRPDEQSTMFHPSETELTETNQRLLAEVERVKPARVVFDSLAELRLLAQNPLRHRRQLVALKRFFLPRKCTVLMLDDLTRETMDLHLQATAHGVIQLEHLPPEFGADRRRLRVVKMRGKDIVLGWHDYLIRTDGMEVFPRLTAAEHPGNGGPNVRLSSDIKELDALMGGGPSKGTSTIIMGQAGTGKSSIAYQYAIAAARRGERAVIFSFDESLHTALRRAEALGMDLAEHLEAGRIRIEQVDPGQLSPGEFSGRVRRAVEGSNHDAAKVLVIDSLNGYLNAMPAERFLLIQLHELLSYLGQQGVATLLVVSQQGLVGTTGQTPVDTTYLADNTLLLRFFEAAGEVKRAISVIKMRSGKHETTIRELRIEPGGIVISEPLRQFQGVLLGEPHFVETPPAVDGNGRHEHGRVQAV